MSPCLALSTLLAGCTLACMALLPGQDDPPNQSLTPKCPILLQIQSQRHAVSLAEEEEVRLRRDADSELERVRAPPGSLLSCTFDTDTRYNLSNKKEIYAGFRGWGWKGKIANEQILAYSEGTVDSWSSKDYTAKNVSDNIAESWQLLNDLVKRAGKRYWVVCGTLIGVLRHRSFITKDADGDFCITPFSGQQIGDAYPEAPEHFLYEGRRGQVYGKFITYKGKPFVVAYEGGGAQLIIWSLNSGLKVEMDRRAYHCDSVHALGRGQPITLEGGTPVVIPDEPYEMLRLFYGPKILADPTSIPMPLEKFTSCSVCQASQMSKVCNGPGVFDGGHNGLRPTRVKQYVFVFVGTDRVRWSCTRASAELSGCTPAGSGRAVSAEGQLASLR